MYRTLIRIATTAAVVLAAVAVAAAPAWAADPALMPLAVKSLPEVIDGLIKWVTGIIAAVATLFLTIGGVRYVIADGDPGQVEKAKSALTSAGVGYALAALAPVLLTVVQGLVK